MTEIISADSSLDRLCTDTIRTLAMDAVQQAKSGHPGTPMALAPVAYTLWQKHLRYDTADPTWINRDRFVLSNGHASMLLYAILHLAGIRKPPSSPEAGELAVTLDDIRNFRQLGSKCPGHPEYGLTWGVETTTGPLAQGCGTSVGMAIARSWLAMRYNQPHFELFDYDIFTFCSDGDMMEGLSSEAASLAGHLRLADLCWIYDRNHITIEGSTGLAFSEDTGARFRAYGWQVVEVADANDTGAVSAAIEAFRANRDTPTLIIVTSHIGYGAPHKQDTAAAHGEPLGEDEVRLAKRFYGWPEDAKFLVPDGVLDHFRAGIGRRGAELRRTWSQKFDLYRTRYPELAAELDMMQKRKLPEGWDEALPRFEPDAKGMASRDAAGKVLNAIAPRIPWLIGGAGDLSPSTKTRMTFDGSGDFEAATHAGRNLHFGIREHAMAAAVNGLALSGLRSYGSTFLIFSDYAKPAIRLAALMELPLMHIFTHDSIGLGEDGPTHQSVEQLLALRAVPNLMVLRPADANEVAESWRVILGHQGPVALVLSRQALPTLDRSRYAPAAGVARGAYILADARRSRPDVILIATGSAVTPCVPVYEQLKREGVGVRLVSMPSWELFEAQDRAYRDRVLPPDTTARVTVEEGSVIGWERYAGPTGARIGMTTFGASAPAADLMRKFGFTPENILAAARQQLRHSRKRAA